MYFILWNNWWPFKRKTVGEGWEKVVFSIGYQAFNKTIPVIILENVIWLNPRSNDKQGAESYSQRNKRWEDQDLNESPHGAREGPIMQ